MIIVTPMGQRYALLVGDNVVGRHPDCDLRLHYSSLSRRHAVVHWDGQQATITDLGSTNGTVLNGERLEPHRAYPLGAGDHLELAGPGGRLEVRLAGKQGATVVLSTTPEPIPVPTSALQPLSNPYVGPRAFQRGERLYGRDHEVMDLLDLIIAERIVLLYSPSGAGKTSLIQAALIPELEQEGFRALPPMRVSLEPGPRDQAATRPANRYILSLLLSLEETLPPEEQMSLERLATFSLDEYLDRRRTLTGEEENTVLVFDQFEEILTVDPANRKAKSEFFEQVAEALRDRSRWALFSMREEFLAGLDPYLRPLPTRLSTTYRLELLGPNAALEAIQEPAQSAGVEFMVAAATKLVDDLRQIRVQLTDGSTREQTGVHVEPVQLQVVCRRLWDRLPPGRTEIVEADVEAVGDVDSALASYYAERVAAISAETSIRERAIREWCDRQLITEQGIRGQVLQGQGQSEGLENRAIWPLVDAHLVRAEQRRGATWFELAHDRLIDPVRADNAVWRETHLSSLQRQAALWRDEGRPDGLLLQGEALAEAETWAAAHDDELTEVERDFLADCRQAQAIAEREQRQQRRIRWLAVGATAFSIVAVILAIVAGLQTRAATTARDQAEQEARRAFSGQLAAQAQAAIQDYPQRGLLLALEASNVLKEGDPRVPSAEQALRDVLGRFGGVSLSGHMGVISEVAFRPDGQWLATASRDQTIRLWNLEAEDPAAESLVLRGHEGDITSGVFSPDGRWLATGSEDTTVGLWDLSALSQAGSSTEEVSVKPLLLRGHSNVVTSVAFSPDGRWLASGGFDQTVRVWDVSALGSGAEPLLIHDIGDRVLELAFSHDSRVLASGSDDGSVWLWDVSDLPASGSEPHVLHGHQGGAAALAFSPNELVLASGGEDSITRLWELSPLFDQDLQAQEPVAPFLVLRGHEDWVASAAFSPDGRWLATSSNDKTTRLWDLEARDPSSESQVIGSHEAPVTSVRFSPDGRTLATGSGDHSARLWDVSFLVDINSSDEDLLAEPQSLREQGGSVRAAAFSPDGQWLVVGGDGGPTRLWDVSDNTVLRVGGASAPHLLDGHAGGLRAVAFSPDGRWLVTGGLDNTIRLWDLSALPQAGPSAEALVVEAQGALGSAAAVLALAFSSDGRWLASGHDDHALRLWDVSALPGTGGGSGDLAAQLPASEAHVLRGHEGLVSSVAFSSDGRWLASGSEDRTARLWDASDPLAEPQVLSGHEGRVSAVAFSPDGNWLATGSGHRDLVARLWDVSVDSGPVDGPISLPGHTSQLTSVAFSPDGRWLATGSLDATARLWDVSDLQDQDSMLEPVVLHGHEDGVMTLAFSSDGRWLVTGGLDGKALLWRTRLEDLKTAACQVVGRNLRQDEWEQFFLDEDYRRTCENLPVHSSVVPALADSE